MNNTTTTEVLDTTPVTGDVIAWLDVNYPEGDVAVVHTADCDRVSCGDECVGGCAVVFA